MQKKTKVMNGLIRIEGTTTSAILPFEAPLENSTNDDFHILEMVEYCPAEPEAFIIKALELLTQYKSAFDRYRDNQCKIYLHLAIEFAVSPVRFKPSTLNALASHQVCLEVYDD